MACSKVIDHEYTILFSISVLCLFHQNGIVPCNLAWFLCRHFVFELSEHDFLGVLKFLTLPTTCLSIGSDGSFETEFDVVDHFRAI